MEKEIGGHRLKPEQEGCFNNLVKCMLLLVQGKCQFFKVLKVKKAETSVVQVYLNIIFEYI